MTELEMYELWLTLREWANYNQLNQTIEKNWLSNSFNSHILDLLDKEEIKYRSEKRLLGYRNKGKRRLAGNANQPIIISIDDVADIIDVWCCTIKVDIENSKGQYIEKDKQEATKDGSESTKIQHGI